MTTTNASDKNDSRPGALQKLQQQKEYESKTF
jgi:hypothetical protein